ncbi:MAG: aminotransferase [Kiloniellales bacterium]|jgi:4-aminobutyrate--pyruvate transaminase|nr:aminotransferase [Kiloniellales bacterium]
MLDVTGFVPDSWEGRDLRSMLHGFTHLGTLRKYGPVVITRGEGIYVEDTQGRRYLEGNSGLWNMVVGFDHAGLIEAACDQVRKFPAYHAFFGRVSEPSVALAERLLEIAPTPMSKVFFTNSGSEANDTVVKMLWMINHGEGRPQCRKILSRRNAYHGVTAVTASMTGKDYVGAFGLPLDGFLFAECPHYWRFGREGESEAEFTHRCARDLEAQIEAEGPETIAGFFAEPVMGAGGVIPPPEGYFAAIQPILKKYNIPLVADEVICGLGRTGKLWGCETYGIEPDILVASKCLTAGYFPMGAILVSENIQERLLAAAEEFEEFPHGFTTAAHPVGCAIALKAIDVILNEGVFDNVVAVAPHFQLLLKELEAHPQVGEARGIGLMGALELVANKQTKAPFPPEQTVSEDIANVALEHGLICRPIGQAIVLAPPFIITRAQIDELFEKLRKTLEHVLGRQATDAGA